jgi:hypothetical protein
MSPNGNSGQQGGISGGAALLIGVGVAGAGIAGFLLYQSTANKANLTGTVVSAVDGSAIVGAAVVIGKQKATSGAGGIFTMKGLPVGKNSVGIAAAGFIAYSDNITLVAGNQKKTFPMAKTVTQAALTGVATDKDTGTPLAGVKVSISGKSATTAADGTYTIAGLSTGNATATASLSGYAQVTQALTLITGSNPWNPALTDRGTVTGTVTDSVTGEPIAGAQIAGPAGSGIAATSNANGLYSLIATSFVTSLGCAASGYQTQSQPISVQPGGSTPLNFSMVKNFTETGTIQGTITNANDGTPISNATIVFQPGSYSTKSGSNGFYTIDLPTGAVSTNYGLTATAAGFNQWTGSVLLAVGAIATKNIGMTPVSVPPGVVAGVVLNAAGTSYLAGVLINILRLDGSQTGLSTTTDANGYYVINNVPAGNYTIWASKSGYAQKSQALTVVSGQTTFEPAFYLSPQATAIGFKMDIMVDPSNYPEAYYWYADINDDIFNWFALINNFWDGQQWDMTQFPQQTLTVQLYDANYNPIYNNVDGTIAKAVVPLGGLAGPLIKNDHIYSFDFDRQVLIDEGLL